MGILENRLKINHLSVHLRKIYIYIYIKNKFKVNKRKKQELEQKSIEKICECKSCFFEKISKTNNKTPAKLTKGKKKKEKGHKLLRSEIK